jgi:cytochrome d ubiquinol oxidase subunit II
MLNTIWFVVLASMLAGYAILDGFDLGAGSLHLWLGRTASERSQVIDAIGPVWNGNEVWLIAAGGALVVAFPTVYATSFSGFYLALMLVLWLLLLRGIAIEFRHQLHHEMWQDAWDVVLNFASVLLAVLFGVALANVLRGLPLDAGGQFVGTFTLMLNPFALIGGLLSAAILSLHGANYVAVKTEGAVHARARAAAGWLWWGAVALLAVMIAASFVVRPDFTANFLRWPWLIAAPLLAIAAAIATRVYLRRGDDLRAFLSSAAWIGGILFSVAAGLYPLLLPARAGSAHPGLDIYNSASPAGSLRIALGIYAFGMTLVTIYMVNIYRIWRGKVSAAHSYSSH